MRAAAAKNRSGVKEGGQWETEGGEGRENVTVNMGQELSRFSCVSSYSHLTLDLCKWNKCWIEEMSPFSLVICKKQHTEWGKNQIKNICILIAFHFLLLPQRFCSSIAVRSVCVVLFPSAVCNLTRASLPAITINYPPVTAELMFSSHHSGSRTVTERLSGRWLCFCLHTSQSEPGTRWRLQLTEACTNKINQRSRWRCLMDWRL